MDDGKVRLPSDVLMRRGWRDYIPSRDVALAGLATIVVVAASITGLLFLANTGTSAPAHHQTRASAEQHKTVSGPAVVAVADRDTYTVTEPAPENHYNHDGPVQCPAGTTPNAVDAYGNESACAATGGSGGNQPCVAYDANNHCTQYYKP